MFKLGSVCGKVCLKTKLRGRMFELQTGFVIIKAFFKNSKVTYIDHWDPRFPTDKLFQ